MIERIVHRRTLIDSPSKCLELAEDCSTQIFQDPSIANRTTNALAKFTGSLFGVEQVNAVAILAHNYGKAPTTLVVEVFSNLEVEDDKLGDMVRQVGQAKALLTIELDPIMPNSLDFVNEGADQFKNSKSLARARWNSDKTTQLLAFGEFSRPKS